MRTSTIIIANTVSATIATGEVPLLGGLSEAIVVLPRLVSPRHLLILVEILTDEKPEVQLIKFLERVAGVVAWRKAVSCLRTTGVHCGHGLPRSCTSRGPFFLFPAWSI